jgi:serine phosphatase RsbU (regulator of sigma subunit)
MATRSPTCRLESISFSEVEVVLGRGDLVLFYTDALTEAADADGRLLGEASFLELVRSPLKIPGSMGAT